MDVDAPDVEGLVAWKASNAIAHGDLSADRGAGHDEAVPREDECAVHRKPEVTGRSWLVRGPEGLEDLAAQTFQALSCAERKRDDR
jgi:hypothetical protein